ncbi:MAG: exodeoxyribonuclease VII small subunit [Ruminococcaceae bacterium]|nr:exodeoxyribonuclease VII small subunit [Oscillospiraceae bacterium]
MDSENMSFEQCMARLEEITRLLEKGDVPLEQSLKYFEEGTALAAKCRALLDSAEQKVKLLIKNSDGTLGVRDFDADVEG